MNWIVLIWIIGFTLEVLNEQQLCEFDPFLIEWKLELIIRELAVKNGWSELGIVIKKLMKYLTTIKIAITLCVSPNF